MEAHNVNKELSGFSGTENWYKHPASGLLYTDGVQHLAEEYECYWLIDAIFSYNIGQGEFRLTEEFQKWQLIRVFDGQTPTSRFCLMADDGRGNILAAQDIASSDFKGDWVTLYFTNDVLLLPSEN